MIPNVTIIPVINMMLQQRSSGVMLAWKCFDRVLVDIPAVRGRSGSMINMMRSTGVVGGSRNPGETSVNAQINFEIPSWKEL